MTRQNEMFRQVEGIKMADITAPNDELRSEYDETSLKNGIREKYVERYAAGTNILSILRQILPPFFPMKKLLTDDHRQLSIKTLSRWT